MLKSSRLLRPLAARTLPRAQAASAAAPAAMTASVGVVTTVGCPYCKKAKAALRDKGVEYAEADLGSARDVLAKVKETTGQGTVPQIFIAGDFVGGASELLALIEGGQLEARVSAAAGKGAFPSEIADLVAQHVGAEAEAAASPEDEEARALGDALAKELAWSDTMVESRKVAPSSAVAAFLQKSGKDVEKTALLLLQKRELAFVSSAEETFDAQSTSQLVQLPRFARASPPKKGGPLNVHIPWWGPARAAVDVSGDLRGKILALYDKHLAPDGRAVDYAGLARDPLFGAYVDATAELQKVDLFQMGRDEKIAFFVNVYNALIVHGTVVLGTPANLLKRLSFFGDVAYRIGGHMFSANDIEHGVLRDNAASPASVGSLIGVDFLKKPQLPEGDARRDLRVSPLDPRIHFALVCGAKSCPPIKLYTPDNLEEGLQEASVAFCEGEVEPQADGTILLSKIFKWYGADFSLDPQVRVRKIAEFCAPEKAAALNKIAAEHEGKKLEKLLKYKHYDWSSNSK